MPTVDDYAVFPKDLKIYIRSQYECTASYSRYHTAKKKKKKKHGQRRLEAHYSDAVRDNKGSLFEFL